MRRIDRISDLLIVTVQVELFASASRIKVRLMSHLLLNLYSELKGLGEWKPICARRSLPDAKDDRASSPHLRTLYVHLLQLLPVQFAPTIS